MENVSKISDRVEVIRCRDCIWCAEENKFCTYLLGKVRDDFYCAMGEQREAVKWN